MSEIVKRMMAMGIFSNRTLKELLKTSLLSGLVSYWPLDEASGATRTDSHGVDPLSNNGTVGVMTGILGNAAAFDNNSSNYLSHIYSPTLSPGDIDYTFNVWVYMTNRTAIRMIFSQYSESVSLGYELFYYHTDNRFHWDVGRGSNTTPIATAISNTFGALEDAKWYMVTVCHDSVNNCAGIRVNAGAWDWVNTTAPSGKSSQAFQVGHRTDAYKHNGGIGLLGYWQRLLTDGEVTALYNNGAGLAYPFLNGLSLYSTVDTTVSGADARILVPNNQSGNCYPLVVYHHGVSETFTAITADALKKGVVMSLLGAGYMVVGSTASGENWGNAASLTDYRNLINYLKANYHINRIIQFGQSMGGQSSLLTLTGIGTVSKGWFGIYPVCSLADMFGANAGTYAGAIRTAYGIAADGSDYAAKTTGHDPALSAAALYDGFRMRFYASAADSVVNKTNNTDALKTLTDAHATENTVLACSGTHGDPSHFNPLDVVAFCNRCV